MLDKILKRDDVSNFIYEIENNARYYDKESDNSVSYQLYVDKEHALFIVYSALLKYKIIIDDIYYFDNFLEQLEKLFKKLDNFNDISIGVNRLIGSVCALKLGVENVEENREEVLRYIYDKYIVNGYFVHGYSSCYESDIKKNGFIPEVYKNNYDDFINVNKIFAKYNVVNILDKDFSKKEVKFTDSFIMGCYYSINSPGYLYKLLCNRDYSYLRLKKDAYSKNNYQDCIRNLKKICFSLEMSDADKKYVLNVVKKEWDLLHKNQRKISLLLVKRSVFCVPSSIKIDNLVNDKNISFGEAVDRILISRSTNVTCNKKINKEDIEFISLDGMQEVVKEEEKKKEEIRYKQEMIMTEFQDSYGKVSALLLIGSILITLGVIMTIIMIFGG